MMKSMRDASKETGLTYHFIRNLVLENKIKFVRSGKKVYVNMNSLLDFCNQTQNHPQTEKH